MAYGRSSGAFSMRNWFSPVMTALALAFIAPAHADVRFRSDGDLLRSQHLPPSLGLIFRGPDGERVSREVFFKKINEGLSFYVNEPIHVGRAVLTLGNPQDAEQPPPGQVTKLRAGDPMPTFHGTALDGSSLSNRVFEGRLTLIDFFGVDCGACIGEIPELNAFKARHPEIQTLAVTTDAAEYARDLVQHRLFRWRVVADQINLVYNTGVWFAPTYALVDQRGRLLAATSSGSLHAPGKVFTGEDLARWVERYETLPSPSH
jgi:peroxiredoxin